MNLPTFVVAAGLMAVLMAIIARAIQQRKQGKSLSCSDCNSCQLCPGAKKAELIIKKPAEPND